MMDESGTDAKGCSCNGVRGTWTRASSTLRSAGRCTRRPAADLLDHLVSSRSPGLENAVYDAFVQLWAKDPAEVSSVTGLAKVIARRRRQDIGKRVVREREQIEELLTNPLAMAATEFRDQDVRAARRRKSSRYGRGMHRRLTEEQRNLVTKTIMGQEQIPTGHCARARRTRPRVDSKRSPSRQLSAVSRRSATE